MIHSVKICAAYNSVNVIMITSLLNFFFAILYSNLEEDQDRMEQVVLLHRVGVMPINSGIRVIRTILVSIQYIICIDIQYVHLIKSESNHHMFVAISPLTSHFPAHTHA